jgi:hypothetical protein
MINHLQTLAAALLALVFLGSGSGIAAPTRLASYGPNGTHWPERIPTPFLYTATANDVEVACTRAALTAALAAVTPEQANAGMRILVQPGGLDLGTRPLENLGSRAWTKRVTVCPRDGWGTVSWGGYINNVHNVCFAGFAGESILASGCSGSALAWCKITNYLGWMAASDCEFAECVIGTYGANSQDISQVYTSGANTERLFWDGCYWPPHYLLSNWSDFGEHPHTDSLQFAEVNGGRQSAFEMRDCALFASNNAAIQAGNIDGFILRHTYMAAGEVSRSRYPVPAGASGEDGGYIFNGAGKNFEAHDCVFLGAVAIGQGDAGSPYRVVSNTQINNIPASYLNPSVSGAWTVNTALNASNSGMPPLPTDQYLSGIWSKQQTPQRPQAPRGLRVVPKP